ncbi:MAG: hypothetical protein ACI4S2_12585, partial [Lachnospiraceae bacterium]
VHAGLGWKIRNYLWKKLLSEQSYARYFDIRNINPKHCFEYLKIDNPNLDILMKALELKEPETIEELSHVLFVLYNYFSEWHNEDEYIEIANKHPEVLEYARKKLENHEYPLGVKIVCDT